MAKGTTIDSHHNSRQQRKNVLIKKGKTWIKKTPAATKKKDAKTKLAVQNKGCDQTSCTQNTEPDRSFAHSIRRVIRKQLLKLRAGTQAQKPVRHTGDTAKRCNNTPKRKRGEEETTKQKEKQIKTKKTDTMSSTAKEQNNTQTREKEDISDVEYTSSEISEETEESDIETDYGKENSDSDDEHIRKMFSEDNIGGPTCVCRHCNAVLWKEERNNKANKTNPTFSLCCQDGKITLPTLKDAPPLLKRLMDCNGDRISKAFRMDDRKYNSMFAMTSLGATVDTSVNEGKGPYVFKINGQNHHRIGTLLPSLGAEPKFSQLYVYDTENEADNRTRVFADEDGSTTIMKEVVQGLIDMFDQCNELIKVFRTARDRFKDAQDEDIKIRLIGHRSKDARQYNLPTCSEIAGLMVGNQQGKEDQRDVIIESREGHMQRITELHPSYMAMQYPILFPYGEDGYMPNVPKTGPAFRYSNKKTVARKQNTISQRAWYAYRIQDRLNESNLLITAGKLLQQYMVDAYTSVEEERLRYIRKHQDDIRAELYQGLVDAVIDGDHDAAKIGKRTVLPSSFTGGPRYMVQNYQDAIAICRKIGSPDLFITVTCNPKWDEILQGLKRNPGLKPHDRPDLVTRIFRVKLLRIMDDFIKKKHFGKVMAAIYTVEFQKRGLPHAHILLFLHHSSKFRRTRAINKVISAELPDKDKDPKAYKAVVDFMMHGPCGEEYDMSCPCMVKGKCSKHFPRKNSNVTTKDKEGFYYYRRREDGRTATVKGVELDNKWVVPHNVDLLVKYQCHINVEACNQGRALKYLFKYIHKGKDRTTMKIERNKSKKDMNGGTVVTYADECTRYQDCRYISAAEAAHRIFKFPIQYRKPSVVRLSFHEENGQQVLFRDDDDPLKVIANPSASSTMFLKWMELNKRCKKARKYLYADIPAHYVWVNNDWQERKKGTAVGRIFHVDPTAGEKYYMRLLLNHVKGAQTFEDIKKYQDVVYSTHKEACLARGLLEDDGEWHECMREASHWASPVILRHLFVSMLLHCEVTDPRSLWEEHWQDISQDAVKNKRRILRNPHAEMTEDEIRNVTLCEIEILLNDNNRSLKDYKPMPVADMRRYYKADNRLIQEELDYDCDDLRRQFEEMHSKLNTEQTNIFNEIIGSALNKEGGFFFVYGSGGTGKTFLWRTILAKLRSERKIVLPVASSGIASLLLQGGRTAHSRFKIPIEVDDSTTCNISQQTDLAELIRISDLVIWDEAPTNHRNVFEAVDKTLRDLMKRNDKDAHKKPFGGKTIVLGGDFRQTLPVIQKGSREDIVAASINKSYLWDACKIFRLKTNMRLQDPNLGEDKQEEIREFSDWVLKLGEGRLKARAVHENEDDSWVQIPEDLLLRNVEKPLDAIISSTYPDIENKYCMPNYLKDRCILTPTNECAHEVNTKILNRLPGDSKMYPSADKLSPVSSDVRDQDILYPTEYLNTLTLSGIPNHMLELKVGVPIMLIRNINPSKGMCNGTRLVVTKLQEKIIQAKIITGSHVGDPVAIHRIVMSSTPTKWPFILRRRQFPVKVCFSMTINKSQGQTLQKVGIYLQNPVFSHGQLYVAVSRTTSREGLRILIDKKKNEPEGYTQNVVYQEIFNNLPKDVDEVNNSVRVSEERGQQQDCAEHMYIQADYQDKTKVPALEECYKDQLQPTRTSKQGTSLRMIKKQARKKYIEIQAHPKDCVDPLQPTKRANTGTSLRFVKSQAREKFQYREKAFDARYLQTQLPKQILEYISGVEDPAGDGNCGYRALSMCINKGERQWRWMRQALQQEIERNREYYQILFEEEGAGKLLRILDHNKGRAPRAKWMDMPSTGFVFAQAFNTVVVSLTKTSCWTCVPMLRKPSEADGNIHTIAFINDGHYIKLNMKPGCPIPPIPPEYDHAVTNEISAAWRDYLAPRIDAWNNLKIVGMCERLSFYNCILIG